MFLYRFFLLPMYGIVKLLAVTNIILILLAPLLLILLIRDFFVSRSCKNGLQRTIGLCEKVLGYIIYITGIVGAGKTTLMMGLGHIFQKIILKLIDKDMQHCKRIIWQLDYNELNELITKRHEEGIRYEQIHQEFITSPVFEDFHGKEYDDGINRNQFDELMKKYIRAKYRLIDHNFVMSNIDCKSRITNNWNKNLKKENMQIKLQKCFIENFNVLLWDEATLAENNIDNSALLKEDKGKSIFYRIIRQMGEESLFLIHTAQCMERDFLLYRELATSEPAVRYFRVVETTKARNLINGYRRLMLNIEKALFMKLYVPDPEVYENRSNVFKERDAAIMESEDKAASKASLSYSSLIKVKGEAKEYIDAKLVLPINWCFGVTDTHYWKLILIYLKSVQKESYYDTPTADNLNEAEKDEVAKQLLIDKHDEKERKKEEYKKKHEEELAAKAKARKEAKIKAAKEKARAKAKAKKEADKKKAADKAASDKAKAKAKKEAVAKPKTKKKILNEEERLHEED